MCGLMPSQVKSAPTSRARHAPYQARQRLGQTILEATLAAGIMATAIASALTLTQASLNAEKQSETSIVAANLAREGIEAVRGLRDSNWLSGADFLSEVFFEKFCWVITYADYTSFRRERL